MSNNARKYNYTKAFIYTLIGWALIFTFLTVKDVFSNTTVSGNYIKKVPCAEVDYDESGERCVEEGVPYYIPLKKGIIDNLWQSAIISIFIPIVLVDFLSDYARKVKD